MFYQMVKRVSIDVFEFLALLMGIMFYYLKMTPFVKAAIALNYVNGQTVSYLIFSILLIIVPIALLACFRRVNKASVMRYIFYAFGVVILTGTVFDILTYNWFIDYTFVEGDAIFVNLMWNMPNITGIVFSILVSLLYFLLGKQIKRTRRLSCLLYMAIFLLSHVPPIVVSFITTGELPRDIFLQKSLFVLMIQLFTLAAITIAATSRTLWKRHIWN